jgi:hypothetical protein
MVPSDATDVPRIPDGPGGPPPTAASVPLGAEKSDVASHPVPTSSQSDHPSPTTNRAQRPLPSVQTGEKKNVIPTAQIALRWVGSCQDAGSSRIRKLRVTRPLRMLGSWHGHREDGRCAADLVQATATPRQCACASVHNCRRAHVVTQPQPEGVGRTTITECVVHEA